MITFLGDVALISGNLSSKYKPQYPYIFNCEYVIGNRSALIPTPNKINLCSENADFEALFGCNPIAVSVANNHTEDFGEAGFRQTVSVLNSKQIGVIQEEPYYLNDNLCIMAYTVLDPAYRFAFDYDKVQKDINGVRETHPEYKIIVQIHWGIENLPVATAEQKRIGYWLIDHGVDLVIGHHPHCIQPIECYKGKYICYSLGNGLFGDINLPSHYDQDQQPRRTYRIQWQPWHRKSLAINYDERTGNITVDELYQQKNTLICKKQNVSAHKYALPKGKKRVTYMMRKYMTFLLSNAFVDGKVFDLQAVKMEMSKWKK